jgi:hypothetical protein
LTARRTPHESVIDCEPHTKPLFEHSCASDSAMHWHTLPEQTPPLAQPPQLVELPQALVIVPHWLMRQRGVGHTHVLVDVLQLSPAPQLPQLAVRDVPQLSAAVLLPHVAPVRAQNAASVSG